MALPDGPCRMEISPASSVQDVVSERELRLQHAAVSAEVARGLKMGVPKLLLHAHGGTVYDIALHDAASYVGIVPYLPTRCEVTTLLLGHRRP